MARGAFDIYYFLLFVPIVLIPFSPTSVLSLQPLFGLLYGAKQAAWHSNICLLFLGLIKFLSIYFPWVPNHCSSFLMSPVYLVNGKSKASHVFLFEPLTSGLYRQHGKEEKGLGSLHYSHCPTLCSALMQSVQPAQDKHNTLGPAHNKAWPVQAGLEPQRLRQVLLTLQKKTTKATFLGYLKHSFKIGSSQRHKKK